LFASIHFLLRGKTKNTSFLPEILNASIRFPLAREDQPSKSRNDKSILLQSTSLLRGKTQLYCRYLPRNTCFNPLPSCEGRRRKQLTHRLSSHASIHFPLAREDKELQQWRWKKDASIHFPLAREDRHHMKYHRNLKRFNPLPSCEGRLLAAAEECVEEIASIHFPLAREDEFDMYTVRLYNASIHFPLAREDELPHP